MPEPASHRDASSVRALDELARARGAAASLIALHNKPPEGLTDEQVEQLLVDDAVAIVDGIVSGLVYAILEVALRVSEVGLQVERIADRLDSWDNSGSIATAEVPS